MISNRQKRRMGVIFAMSNDLDFKQVYYTVKDIDASNEEELIHELEKRLIHE